MLGWNSGGGVGAKLIELRNDAADSTWPLAEATDAPAIRASLLGVYSLGKNLLAHAGERNCLTRRESRWCGSAAIARRRAEIAEMLVKSTSAICAAIGAQPIPLADLPILTTLQLVMVSGIMYISGRERSMRAATEFVGAIGANVGLGMILREGTRAALKFFPGWGNVVCGMVAGAGTFAIGRAAIGLFHRRRDLARRAPGFRAEQEKANRAAGQREQSACANRARSRKRSFARPLHPSEERRSQTSAE